MQSSATGRWTTLLGLSLAALSGPSCAPRKPAGPAFGGVPVHTEILKETTITDYDEYLASLTSRRSITLYPQVNGYIKTIRVKPGEKVASGRLLVEIDPGQQAATLRSLAATLETKRSNLAYADQNDESSKSLVQAGLLGQLDYDQRHSQKLASEADVRAGEAQLQAQKELLRFYQITAPTDGVVGDIPVKVGDYVTPQTRLTSVDQSELIEAYVYLPITKAEAIKPETTLQLLNDSGKVLCEEKPSFIASQVSADTQTILVKTICPNAGQLRAAEVLKARVIWARHPGLTIPTAAATRQSGQYFAFVAERGPKGTVAHQRPIEVGSIQGNSFVVTKGLAVGDEVVVSNVQKVREGVPVIPAPPPEAGADAGH